jgi:AraC family transcriptional regulator
MHEDNTAIAIAPPRIVKSDALLIFGLGQRYHQSNAGMPAQWNRFIPHLGSIPGQVGNVTYGVISKTDESGTIDYICGVQVREFPSLPSEFTRLRIPPQTYALFEHKDHVSSVANMWKAVWDHAITDAGREATDGPAFERYDERFDPRTGLGGFEIWVPIKV